MKKENLTLYLFLIVFMSITFPSCASGVECQKGLNLLPMYGNVKKCPELLQSDKEFLAYMDTQSPDRAKTSKAMVEAGIAYINRGDNETAMKRMNQAWLLDKDNVSIYTYYTLLLALDSKTDEAVKMLDLTLEKIRKRKDPTDPSTLHPSNEWLTDVLVSNVFYSFERTRNETLLKHLYGEISSLNLPDANKQLIRDAIKKEVTIVEV